MMRILKYLLTSHLLLIAVRNCTVESTAVDVKNKKGVNLEECTKLLNSLDKPTEGKTEDQTVQELFVEHLCRESKKWKTLNKVNIFRVIGTKVRESKAVRCKRCKLAFEDPSFKNRQIEFDKDDRRSLTVKTITFSGWLLGEQYKNVVKNRIIEVKMAPCRVFFPVSDPTKKLTETHWTMYGNKKKLLFIGGEVVPHDSQTNVEIMRYIKINCSFRKDMKELVKAGTTKMVKKAFNADKNTSFENKKSKNKKKKHKLKGGSGSMESGEIVDLVVADSEDEVESESEAEADSEGF